MVDKPSKKRTTRAKKATPRRAVVTNTTARRKASKQLNEARLQDLIRRYQENVPTNTKRRTKANERHPRGVPLENLEEYVDKHGTIRHRSVDRSIDLSEIEYSELLINPYAVPRFTPIHEVRRGKKRIVAYRDVETGHEVSPYFMSKYFRPYFNAYNRTYAEEDRERARAYEASIAQQKKDTRARQNDLITSYGIRNPQFEEQWPKSWRSKIAKDPTFNALVDELETWHYKMFGITEENIIIYDEAYNIPVTLDTLEEQKEWLISQLGKDKRYQEVLVLLGRRLESDTNPVGESDPNHIKTVVRPYYEALFGGQEFSEGEE